MKRSRIRRIGLATAVLLAAAAIAGFAYETAARRSALRTFPPAGRRVDVGGRHIQIDCRGAGSPTVVLEAGLDRYGSLGWEPVHDSLAQTTRTCAYSRAGILWSDPAPGPFDSRRASRDLHSALVRAGERPPWVLAGHSLGGPYAVTFTALYPRETAGLVLVDATHPDARHRMRKATGAGPSLPRRAGTAVILAAGPALARLGIARLAPRAEVPDGWSARMGAAYEAFHPASGAAFLAEARAMDESLRTAGRARQLGARPLVVLTADAGTRPPREAAAWHRLQVEMAAWSSRGRQETVDASHYIHMNRPDVVIRAVREVLAEVRETRVPPDAAGPPSRGAQ
jgi:pimeloyl-ACP methyl ester carboxylesterase